MKTVTYFDEQAKRLIQEGLFRIRRQPYGHTYEEERPVTRAPEVAVVKIPTGGIPAASVSVIEGPYTLQYVMGKAECELMYLHRDLSEYDEFNPLPEDINDIYDKDVLASPIERTVGVSLIPKFEYIYNPYTWPVFGFATKLDSNPSYPDTKLLSRATRERGGLWVIDRPPDFYKALTLGAITSGSSGMVKILLAGDTLGPDVEAFNDFASTGTVSGSEEVFVKYFEDERKWVIIKPGAGTGPAADTGIRFTNTAGEDIPPHAVMGVAGESTISSNQYIEAIKPGNKFHITWFVNRGNTVADDDEDFCDIGIDKNIPVLIDPSVTGSIGVGTQLGPKSGSYAVWPGYLGFTAVGDPYTKDGVDVVDCIQHPVTRVFGRLQNDITQNADGTSSGFFEIWIRNPSNHKREPAGWANSIVVRAPLLNLGEQAKTGTFGWAEAYSDNWEGDFACAPDDTNSSQTSFMANQSFMQQSIQQQNIQQSQSGSGSIGTGTGTY